MYSTIGANMDILRMFHTVNLFGPHLKDDLNVFQRYAMVGFRAAIANLFF